MRLLCVLPRTQAAQPACGGEKQDEEYSLPGGTASAESQAGSLLAGPNATPSHNAPITSAAAG
jgi:hypothetical protein